MSRFAAVRAWFGRLFGGGAGGDPEQLATRALHALEHALAENDAESRLQRLRRPGL